MIRFKNCSEQADMQGAEQRPLGHTASAGEVRAHMQYRSLVPQPVIWGGA